MIYQLLFNYNVVGMKVSFAKKDKREVQEKCHGGSGQIVFRKLFDKNDFDSSLEFLHETEVLPGSTIGYHKHTGNEEIYYVIKGKGLMTVDGEENEVKNGDAVITQSGSSHSLKNIGKNNLKIIVFEAKY